MLALSLAWQLPDKPAQEEQEGCQLSCKRLPAWVFSTALRCDMAVLRVSCVWKGPWRVTAPRLYVHCLRQLHNCSLAISEQADRVHGCIEDRRVSPGLPAGMNTYQKMHSLALWKCVIHLCPLAS